MQSGPPSDARSLTGAVENTFHCAECVFIIMHRAYARTHFKSTESLSLTILLERNWIGVENVFERVDGMFDRPNTTYI